MSTGNLKTHHFAHHFDSANHEYESSKQGVWFFMATEIIMFGGMFVAYAIYKSIYPDIFQEGSSFLDWRFGATNTIVLIFSSLTMALSIYYLRVQDRKKAIYCLALTIFCGAVFMCIKYVEYSHKIDLGLVPGKYFSYEGLSNPNGALYFGFYFAMTGMHGLHVLIGMGLITWLLIRTIKGEFGPEYYQPVEGVGIFWHLVDLIWIYLFPMFYLVG